MHMSGDEADNNEVDRKHRRGDRRTRHRGLIVVISRAIVRIPGPGCAEPHTDVEAPFPATKGFESYERETEMNAKIDCGCAGTGGPANGAFFGSEEPVSLSHPVESGSADPEDESGLMDVAIALPQGLHHGYSVQILAIENGK